MHSDRFIDGYVDILDGKVALMSDLLNALAAANSSAETAEALRVAASRFGDFSANVELPFGRLYNDHLKSPPAALREHLASRQVTILEFIRALQELKFGAAAHGDAEIAAAIAAFEHAGTARIPEPGTNLSP